MARVPPLAPLFCRAHAVSCKFVHVAGFLSHGVACLLHLGLTFLLIAHPHPELKSPFFSFSTKTPVGALHSRGSSWEWIVWAGGAEVVGGGGGGVPGPL